MPRRSGLESAVFVAYPAEPQLIGDSIAGAVGLSATKLVKLTPWSKMPVFGLRVDDLVRENIESCDAVAADISVPNFNVYYEIGFALAKEKPIVPIVNVGLSHAYNNIKLTGLFDNIGWLEYSNADELSDQLDNWKQHKWVERYERAKDHAQPLFILDTLKKIEFRQYIFQAVGDRSVNKRTFDPLDVPRLTASRAIAEVSSSAGVILPLLTSDIADHVKHNLRAAFLAGLAHGYDLDPLIIQYGNGPADLDYRDFVTNATSRYETKKHVEDYCAKVLVRNQLNSTSSTRFKLGTLARIDVGASAAENETSSLSKYFVHTAEFARTVRSTHALVVGRKGSGKTAIFYQFKNILERDKQQLVIELRPATHNLSELREELLSVKKEGVFDHTISAFWTYIIYVEILLRIREVALVEAKRNFELQERLRRLENDLELTDAAASGDFTSRLEQAVRDILKAVTSKDSKYAQTKMLTNVVFEKSIPKLREHLFDLTDQFDDLVLLIDDIDKGWPPTQLEPHDVITIRHLVEALRRIERDLRRKDVTFRSFMFLRGDVYENLVDKTADRGKYNPISVDWSDKEQLVNLLRQRITSKFSSSDEQREAWESVNVVMDDGRFAVEHLIEAALYRPRFLIEACEKVISTAINRGNGFVTPAAVEHGLQQMSQYLVSDFGYELRDVAGIPETIFYNFIGVQDYLTEREIESLLKPLSTSTPTSVVIDLLLWYGFLGIVSAEGKSRYIFECSYDYRRLLAERGEDRNEVLYSVNAAFLRGLVRH